MSDPVHVPHLDYADPSDAEPASNASRDPATASDPATRRPRHLDCSEAPRDVDGATSAGRSAPAGRSTRQPRR
jgi:hypothetical protein